MLRIFQNQKFLTAFKTLLTLAFIAVGVYYILSRKEEFAGLGWPSKPTVAIVGAAFLANIYLMSLFNLLVTRRLGSNMSALESFSLSTVTSAANFLLPLRAGTGFRAMYMKRVFNLSYSNFASTLFVFYVANILIASLLGTAAVTTVYFSRDYFALDLFLAFPLVFLISVGFILLRRGQQISSGTEVSWWRQMWNGYRNILSDKKVVFYAFSLVLINFVVSTIAWFAALKEYIPEISISDSFLIVASQVLGGLITVTAGGTGFQELAGIYVGHRLEMTIVELFAVLVWTKVLRILIAVGASAPASIFLRIRLQKSRSDLSL